MRVDVFLPSTTEFTALGSIPSLRKRKLFQKLCRLNWIAHEVNLNMLRKWKSFCYFFPFFIFQRNLFPPSENLFKYSIHRKKMANDWRQKGEKFVCWKRRGIIFTQIWIISLLFICTIGSWQLIAGRDVHT